MPFYEYACEGGHRTEKRRAVEEREDPLACPLCARPARRVMSQFAIGGQHANQGFYEFERDKWALATGKDYRNPAEMERDLKAEGKEIVSPGWKPPKPELFKEHEFDAALKKIYDDNHNVGEVG